MMAGTLRTLGRVGFAAFVSVAGLAAPATAAVAQVDAAQVSVEALDQANIVRGQGMQQAGDWRVAGPGVLTVGTTVRLSLGKDYCDGNDRTLALAGTPTIEPDAHSRATFTTSFDSSHPCSDGDTAYDTLVVSITSGRVLDFTIRDVKMTPGDKAPTGAVQVSIAAEQACTGEFCVQARTTFSTACVGRFGCSTAVVTAPVPPTLLPDLQITGLVATVNEAGNSAIVVVDVTNFGRAIATAATIRVSVPDVADASIPTGSITNLEPDRNTEVRVEFGVPSQLLGATALISARVDAEQQQASGANKQRDVTVKFPDPGPTPAPDLQITALRVDVADNGKSATARVEITNRGNAAAAAATIRMTVPGIADSSIPTATVAGLEPGQRKQLHVRFDVPSKLRGNTAVLTATIESTQEQASTEFDVPAVPWWVVVLVFVGLGLVLVALIFGVRWMIRHRPTRRHRDRRDAARHVTTSPVVIAHKGVSSPPGQQRVSVRVEGPNVAVRSAVMTLEGHDDDSR